MTPAERAAVLKEIRDNIKPESPNRSWDITEDHPANQIRDDHKPYVEKEVNRKTLRPRWYNLLFENQQKNFDKQWERQEWENCEPHYWQDKTFVSFVRPNGTIRLVDMDSGKIVECNDDAHRMLHIKGETIWK